MARARKKEVHSESFPIDQKPDIVGDALPERGGEIIQVEHLFKDHAEELAFAEEPVTIRLEGSRDKNAATAIPIWVNGRGAEIFIKGKWVTVTWLPVNTNLVLKRKYVGVLASAKLDDVNTEYDEPGVARPRNAIRRSTYAFQSFTVLHDPNPKGKAWLEELRRRNFG